MVDDTKNKETMKEVLDSLNQLSVNPTTPKTIKKTLSDLISGLQNKEDSLSVRASNAISVLDDLTQDPNMPSYVRVILWQAVSKLEGIRE